MSTPAPALARLASAPLIFRLVPALPLIVASDRSRSRKRTAECSDFANSFVLFLPILTTNCVNFTTPPLGRIARRRRGRPCARSCPSGRPRCRRPMIGKLTPRACRAAAPVAPTADAHVGEALERGDLRLEHRLAAASPGRPRPPAASASAAISADRRAACNHNASLFLLELISDGEHAVLLQQFAVDLDPSSPAQVADHVRVDGALVDAARLRVAGADREVDRAADLLVEQDRARSRARSRSWCRSRARPGAARPRRCRAC